MPAHEEPPHPAGHGCPLFYPHDAASHRIIIIIRLATSGLEKEKKPAGAGRPARGKNPLAGHQPGVTCLVPQLRLRLAKSDKNQNVTNGVGMGLVLKIYSIVVGRNTL